ncbi:MAG: hypothetical protein ACKO6B_11230, partial [Planctomycetia bacterium]
MAREEAPRPKGPTAVGDDRLHRLISGLADGTLSDAEFHELSARLADDPGARAVWFLRNDIEVGLAHVTVPAAAPFPTPAAAAPASPRRGRLIVAALAATACLVAVVALIGPTAWRAKGARPIAPQPKAASPAAASIPAPLAIVTDARFVLAGNATATPK